MSSNINEKIDIRRNTFGLNDSIFKSLEELTVPITTADGIPGKEYEILGPVLGSIILNTSAGTKGVHQGDIGGSYELTRIQAIHRMSTMATKLGGDAIMSMRFDSNYNPNWSYAEYCAYGVAVKFIEKKAQLPKDDDQTSVNDIASRVSEWTSLSSNTA